MAIPKRRPGDGPDTPFNENDNEEVLGPLQAPRDMVQRDLPITSVPGQVTAPNDDAIPTYEPRSAFEVPPIASLPGQNPPTGYTGNGGPVSPADAFGRFDNPGQAVLGNAINPLVQQAFGVPATNAEDLQAGHIATGAISELDPARTAMLNSITGEAITSNTTGADIIRDMNGGLAPITGQPTNPFHRNEGDDVAIVRENINPDDEFGRAEFEVQTAAQVSEDFEAARSMADQLQVVPANIFLSGMDAAVAAASQGVVVNDFNQAADVADHASNPIYAEAASVTADNLQSHSAALIPVGSVLPSVASEMATISVGGHEVSTPDHHDVPVEAGDHDSHENFGQSPGHHQGQIDDLQIETNDDDYGDGYSGG